MTGKIEAMKMIFRRKNNHPQVSVLLASSCVLFTLGVPATAQDFDVTCTSPADTRQILVLAPGQRGKACDVLYTKNRGRTSSTPYFANSDRDYCIKKAAELQAKLVQSSYSCTGIGADIAARAVVAGNSQSPVSKSSVSQSATAASVSNNRPVQKVAQPETAPTPSKRDQFLRDLKQQTPISPISQNVTTNPKSEAIREQALAQYRQQQTTIKTSTGNVSAVELDGPIVEQQVPAVSDVTRTATANARQSVTPASGPGPLRQSQGTDLVALQSGIANSGPVTLTNPPERDRQPRDNRTFTPVGDARNKLVGATPVLKASAGVDSTAAISNGPVPGASLGTATSSPVTVASNSFKRVASALSPAKANRPRTRPEIITATLMAQAAAWNEGDIEAFMEGYWRSSDLTFVSGTQVTRGWTPTLKRYKQRYGNGASLGQLSFDIQNVEMLANDIAIVVGRFNLNRNSSVDSGTFTLVMKQFEGAWRIVHDHTVADAAAALTTGAQ